MIQDFAPIDIPKMIAMLLMTPTWKMLKNESEMEENEYILEKGSFTTSTPIKRKFECKECIEGTQCTDCFVRETLASSDSIHFSADEH